VVVVVVCVGWGGGMWYVSWDVTSGFLCRGVIRGGFWDGHLTLVARPFCVHQTCVVVCAWGGGAGEERSSCTVPTNCYRSMVCGASRACTCTLRTV
jgi:hypothetical protein